jgi:heme-degrading monooxygenase HmoA
MIRQITLIKFKPGVTADDIKRFGEGFAAISNVVDGIRRFEFGPNLKLIENAYDYALVADFDSESAWKAYVANPDHIAFAQRFAALGEAVVRTHYAV